MADAGKFKVGDRVRTSGWGDQSAPEPEIPNGMTGTVIEVTEGVSYTTWPLSVMLDVPSWTNGKRLLCSPDEIEPLDE